MATKQEIRFGAALGLVLSLVAVPGNVIRGNVHTLHVYPGTVTMALVPLAVFWAAAVRRRAGWHRRQILQFGRRTGLVAGATIGLAVGLLTGYWFSAWSTLGLFAASTGFASVLGLSIGAAWVAGQCVAENGLTSA